MTGTRTDGGRESSPGAAPGQLPGRGGRAMVQKAKILLVDDRPENLLALEAILSALDQTLVRASSGEEALKALLTDDFAVIRWTSRCRGWTASRRPRTSSGGSGPGTSRSSSSPRSTTVPTTPSAATRRVPSTHISKPFDPWVLRAKVSVFVELYMKNCQLREQAALLRLQLEGAGGGQSPAAAKRVRRGPRRAVRAARGGRGAGGGAVQAAGGGERRRGGRRHRRPPGAQAHRAAAGTGRPGTRHRERRPATRVSSASGTRCLPPPEERSAVTSPSRHSGSDTNG